MDRLTDVKDNLDFLVNFLNKQSMFDGNKVKAIHDSLFAYEDTGLTPEEITDHEEIFKAYRSVCGGKSPEEISALIAERDTLKKELALTTNVKNDYFEQLKSYINAFRLHQLALELMCSDLLSAYATPINPENIDLYTKKYIKQAQEDSNNGL